MEGEKRTASDGTEDSFHETRILPVFPGGFPSSRSLSLFFSVFRAVLCFRNIDRFLSPYRNLWGLQDFPSAQVKSNRRLQRGHIARFALKGMSSRDTVFEKRQ